jgi:hypothetical protein
MKKIILVISALQTIISFSQDVEINMPIFKKSEFNQIDYLSRWKGNGQIKNVKTKIEIDSTTSFYFESYSKSGVSLQSTKSVSRRIKKQNFEFNEINIGDTIFFDFGKDSSQYDRHIVIKKNDDTIIREYYFFNSLMCRYKIKNDTVLLYEEWGISGKAESLDNLIAYKYEYNSFGLDKVYKSFQENDFTDSNLIHIFEYTDSTMNRIDYDYYKEKNRYVHSYMGVTKYEYIKERDKYFVIEDHFPRAKKYRNIIGNYIDSVAIYNGWGNIDGYYKYEYDKNYNVIRFEDGSNFGIVYVSLYKYDKKGNVRREKYYWDEKLKYTKKYRYKYW